MTNPTAKLKNPADNARLTPTEVLCAVFNLFDGFVDLDPASDAEANERVKARYIYTKEDNGLNQAWFGKVFLNPPGGKTELYMSSSRPGVALKQVSNVALWWAKLLQEVKNGNTTEAVFVCFNLEAMLNTQKLAPLPIQAFPFCVPSKRLKYQSRNGGKTGSPPGASAIVYVGNRPACFRETFKHMGYVTPGWTAHQLKNIESL